MSLIFQDSCLASKSELDLFTNFPTQAAVENSFSIEILPTTAITNHSPVKFSVSGDSDMYLDLANSYVVIKAKITKANGDPLEDTDEVGPINLFIHSLFQQVEITLNGKVISDASNLNHYRAMFETLLSYSTETKSSQLAMGLYAKDTAGYMDAHHNGNAGLIYRRAFFSESKEVTMIGKPHADVFFQNRYLLNGVDFEMKLIRNNDRLVLMADNASDFRVQLTHASFFVRKVKVNNGIALRHIQELDKNLNPAIYPIRRVTMKAYNIPTGSLSYNLENLFSGQLPKKIFFGLVDSEAFEGAYDKNPFNFKHYNLKYCCLVKDGTFIPHKPLICDFTTGDTLRNYFNLLEASGKTFIDSGWDISPHEYNAGGYCIEGFDLTPDLSESQCYHVIQKGNLRLELRFQTPLPNPVNLVVYSEFDGNIRIDKSRSVMCNFYS